MSNQLKATQPCPWCLNDLAPAMYKTGYGYQVAQDWWFCESCQDFFHLTQEDKKHDC